MIESLIESPGRTFNPPIPQFSSHAFYDAALEAMAHWSVDEKVTVKRHPLLFSAESHSRHLWRPATAWEEPRGFGTVDSFAQDKPCCLGLIPLAISPANQAWVPQHSNDNVEI